MSPTQKLDAKADGAMAKFLEENIERLRQLFSDAVTESSVVLVVCLASGSSIEAVEGVAKLSEEPRREIMRAVFQDAGFKADVGNTKAVQILRQARIEYVKSL